MPKKKPKPRMKKHGRYKRFRSKDGEVWVTIAEVASKSGRHVTTVYRWVTSGKVKHQRLGLGGNTSPSYFIALSSVREMLGPMADLLDL